jgi:hypothetical protein
MSHPMYGAEICDGLDNNCDTPDNGGAALCTLANANEVVRRHARLPAHQSCDRRLPEPGHV